MFISKQAKVAPQRAELGGNGVLAPASQHLFVVTLFLILSCALPARADIVTGLIGWWKMDGGTSGSIANNATAGLTDASGQGHNGTAKNANGTGMAWAQGKFKGAVSLDGVDDYVNIGTGANYFPLPVFSMSAWVKSSGLGSGQQIPGIFNITYGLRFNVGDTGRFQTGMDNGSSFIWQYSSTNLFDNVFHFLCLTYDGISRRMYVDGVNEVSAGTTWLGTTRWPTSDATIGWDVNNNTQHWSGVIDDVRIYNRALSATDVTELYNNGGPTTIRNAVIRNAVIR